MKDFIWKYLPIVCLLSLTAVACSLFYTLKVELKRDAEAFRQKLNNATCTQTKLSLGTQAIISDGKILFICEEK